MRPSDPLAQPHSHEAIAVENLTTQAVEEEQVLFACFLNDEDIAREYAPRLRPGNMSTPAHQVILPAVQSLLARNAPIDLLSLRDEIAKGAGLEVIGGYGYLVDLAGSIPTTAHAPYYFAKVLDKSARRELARAAHRIKALAFNLDAKDPVTSALTMLMNISGDQANSTIRHISEVLQSQYNAIEAAAEARASGQQIAVVSSGFYDFDQLVVLSPKKLIIVAARPAMGKTAWSFQVARSIAKTVPVLHVTLEMAGEELASRVFADEAGISTHQQAHGIVREETWAQMAAILDRYQELNLYIDDAPAATIDQIKAAARRLEAKLGEPLGAIFIDYLGLLDAQGRDDTAKTAAISRASKKLAKELNLPVFLLSQLSRAVESRENKRPQMADLRQSGAIEQDADIVIFLYRDEYYNPATLERGKVEVIIAKHRGGPTATVELHFDAAATRFSDVDYTPLPPALPPAEYAFEEAPIYDYE